jgi:hypothetical protein
VITTFGGLPVESDLSAPKGRIVVHPEVFAHMLDTINRLLFAPT